jgi:hypothetical protein
VDTVKSEIIVLHIILTSYLVKVGFMCKGAIFEGDYR